jgi:hypothetical protein
MKKHLYFLLAIIYCAVLGSCEKQRVNAQIVPLIHNSIVEVENNVSDTMVPEKNGDDFPTLFSFNGLYGYLNKHMQMVIPPIYDRATHFTDGGYAVVRYKEKYGLWECRILDYTGEILFCKYTGGLDILFDDVITYQSEEDGLYKVVRFRNNTIIAQRLGEAAKFSEEDIILVRFFDTNERMFINSTGEKVLPNLELKRTSRGFQEGRAVVVLGETWAIRIIDKNGNFYGNLDIHRAGRNFSEGLLPVEITDGRTGYINKDGEFAFFVPIIADNPDYDESPLNATDFKSGYALVQTVLDPPTWRVINNQGDYASNELSLLWADAFMDGLSRVKVSSAGYGYINTNGDMIIEPIFDSADSFHNGYARIVYQGRDGLINTGGKIFWSDELVNRPENQ